MHQNLPGDYDLARELVFVSCTKPQCTLSMWPTRQDDEQIGNSDIGILHCDILSIKNLYRHELIIEIPCNRFFI